MCETTLTVPDAALRHILITGTHRTFRAPRRSSLTTPSPIRGDLVHFRRLLPALVLAPALLATGPADAALRCPLILDELGDSRGFGVSDEAAYDLVSADVASDRTTLTAVMRLDDIAPDSGLMSPANYMFVVRQGQGLLQLHVDNTPTGTGYRGFASPSQELSADIEWVAATGSIDPAKDEVRISVPLAALPSYVSATPGTVLSGFAVLVSHDHGTVTVPVDALPAVARTLPSAGSVVDEGRTDATYVAGRPSCVTTSGTRRTRR